MRKEVATFSTLLLQAAAYTEFIESPSWLVRGVMYSSICCQNNLHCNSFPFVLREQLIPLIPRPLGLGWFGFFTIKEFPSVAKPV